MVIQLKLVSLWGATNTTPHCNTTHTPKSQVLNFLICPLPNCKKRNHQMEAPCTHTVQTLARKLKIRPRKNEHREEKKNKIKIKDRQPVILRGLEAGKKAILE